MVLRQGRQGEHHRQRRAEALETVGKIMSSNIYKPAAGWADWVEPLRLVTSPPSSPASGSPVPSRRSRTSGQVGVAPRSRPFRSGATHASNLGGSSWYVLESSAEKAEAVDFLNAVYAKDVDFYQTILQDRGAVGSLSPPAGEAAMARPMPSSAVKRSGRTFPTGSRRSPRSATASSPTRRIPPSPRNCRRCSRNAVDTLTSEGDRLRGRHWVSIATAIVCTTTAYSSVEVDLREKLCSNSKCYNVGASRRRGAVGRGDCAAANGSSYPWG